MNIHSIFNRLFFCDSCFFSNAPFGESKVLIYSEREKVYFVYKFKEIEKDLKPTAKGFTPHIVQLEALIQIDEPLVEYKMTCGVCGVEFIRDPDQKLKVLVKKQDTFITRLDMWEDMVRNRL
ncbi:MAG: hypothetical protein RI945_411 [Candidatus Parcubacteria bacterium]|jgi:hypothetical protein